MPTRPLLRLPDSRPLRHCGCVYCEPTVRSRPGTPMEPPLPAGPSRPSARSRIRLPRLRPLVKVLGLVLALVPPILGLLPLALAEAVLQFWPNHSSVVSPVGDRIL